jgi:hypothetical protein
VPLLVDVLSVTFVITLLLLLLLLAGSLPVSAAAAGLQARAGAVAGQYPAK